jgi:hypothetical protein
VLQEGRYSTEELSTAVITSCACALIAALYCQFRALHVRIYSVLQEGRYSTEELSTAVITSCACALVIGFIAGFLVARQDHRTNTEHSREEQMRQIEQLDDGTV